MKGVEVVELFVGGLAVDELEVTTEERQLKQED